MSIVPNFLRSLLLASLFSFVAPLLLIGVGLSCFYLISHLPYLQEVGHFGAGQILKFLATFGNGSPVEGFLVIGITFSLVGVLFDTYASCQNVRGG
ncbi:hypothetical protein PN499_16950 [Kamptonema animale CS-326]|jgi:hypothetical protein|uniref:hypothetical protein n=1 Tax=Kamptonema TaxID=1501433 RepID=UPI0001DAC3C6|nr:MULTISPECIES: hypothetical protein [Kamptonema]MDB9512880.1 hypothetical protein [Kamptonema animale CS-326]CBN55383.1 conserved exported hypothetical protein [Kamptonema sp. PCC 6506]